MKLLKLIVLQITVMTLITVVLLEGLVAASFRWPQWSLLPKPLVRYLHLRFDRLVIQVIPECAIYDPTLSYTLKPGRCVFSSREFSNDYWINSVGLRDDEKALAGPQTVVLGDSVTMGWGVDQNQAFPKVYEKLTGIRTLNAGVSSYGTVRELRLLDRLDLSAVNDLVIQYSGNDTLENRQLVESPPFVILTKASYERFVSNQMREFRYFPGKYAFNVLVQFQAAVRQAFGLSDAPPEVDSRRQAELFIRVVEQSKTDLSKFRVTVLSFDPVFAEAAQGFAKSSTLPWVRNLQFLDGQKVVSTPGTQYVLDDHPTALGHEAIGRLLADYLKDAKRTSAQ